MSTDEMHSQGIVCSAEDYIRSSLTHKKDIHCLTRTDGIGLSMVVEACVLSLVAVLYVFYIILRNLVRRVRHMGRRGFDIFQNPMDLLMFALFFAEILQAIGGVMDIYWIQAGKVEIGSYCNAQGIIQNVGETAVAMTTLTIALYTFIGLWMGRNVKSMFLTKVVLAVIWLFIAVIVIVGNTLPRNPNRAHFQAPTPYWCWVSSDYMTWKYLGEYIWLWLTGFLSIFIYIPLFFWIRGNIEIHESKWWKFRFQRADNTDPDTKARRRQSVVMAAYPAVYCINIIPFSVVRWITFNENVTNVATATFVVTSIYGLSGLFNVILLLWTKSNSSLFDSQVQPADPLLPPVVLSDPEVTPNHHHRDEMEKDDEEEGSFPAGK